MTSTQMSSSSPRQAVTVTLRRDLGLLDVTMIGVGAMIGTSIFVLIGVVTQDVGAGILLVFLFNTVVTIFTASTYAELGSSFPEAGGGYLWAKKALPHPAEFISGWLSWFGHTVACSFYSLGFGYAAVAIADYLGLSILGLSSAILVKLFAVIAMAFFLGINYIGVGTTGKTGTSVTIIQVLIIVFFVAFSLISAFDTKGIHAFDNLEPLLPAGKGYDSIFMSMGFTILAFEGYEIVVQCGEEVKNPKKNIPRAIFASVAVASLLYILVALACFVKYPAMDIGNEGEKAVFFTAAHVIPIAGAPLLIFGGLLSAMAALNATVFSSSRVSFAMGRDGSLPKVFGKIHPVRRIPHNAILITGAIMFVMAMFFPLKVVVASTSVVFLLLFTLANLASIRLIPRLTEIDIGFRTPFFPLFPVIGVITKLALAVSIWWLVPEAWYVALVWIAIGFAASAFAKPREEYESIVAQRRVPPRPLTKEQIERFRVFLALENLGNLRLIELAGIFARYFNGDLTVNKIVEVPRAMPLETISKDYIDDISTSLKKTVKVAPSTVAVRPVVSVSYDVAGSILDQTKHEAANLLVLGWKGTRRRGKTILGRNLDRVVREAPCDVVIIKTARLSKNIENILLVSGGYFETRKALLLALPIAREFGAKIEILSVVTDDKQVELMRGNAERLSHMANRVKVANEVKYVYSRSFVNAILDRVQHSDILVMGAGPQSVFERTLFGATYDRIIRSVDVPVLVVKTARAGKGGTQSLASSRPPIPGLD
jgi:amino acid transporter/nucleotide-binding universal stress UspA family protein